jgi:periplasmic protein TonB
MGTNTKTELPGVPTDSLHQRLSRAAAGRRSWTGTLLSNLRDFFTERPVRVRGGGHGAFTDSGFGASLMDNLKEWLRPLPKEALRGSSPMLVTRQPGLKLFWQNVRDAIAPPKLPPLKISSKPIPVPEIWSKDPQMKRVQALSISVHALLAVLIVLPLLPSVVTPSTTKASNITVSMLDMSPYAPKLPPGPKKAGGGGGGGEHNPLPAAKGRLPKFDWRQFTPPAVKPPENPKLAMTPTVIGPPDLKLPSPNMANYGDPLSKLINDSSGPGSGAGIGSGCCGGVGSGNGSGVGPGEGWGTGGGLPRAGTNGYGDATCLYCPLPQFTDEAVKAKYQGVVLLQAVISADGRATNIRVEKGIGLGLDEKAIEAVRNWRFNPARGPDGKAATVIAEIEVTFRLL